MPQEQLLERRRPAHQAPDAEGPGRGQRAGLKVKTVRNYFYDYLAIIELMVVFLDLDIRGVTFAIQDDEICF